MPFPFMQNVLRLSITITSEGSIGLRIDLVYVCNLPRSHACSAVTLRTILASDRRDERGRDGPASLPKYAICPTHFCFVLDHYVIFRHDTISILTAHVSLAQWPPVVFFFQKLFFFFKRKESSTFC